MRNLLKERKMNLSFGYSLLLAFMGVVPVDFFAFIYFCP